jgi:hypothetical protein
MADQTCEYTVHDPNYRSCREPAPHLARFDGREHPLCDEHVKPKYHPPDVRKKLPGIVKRVVARATQEPSPAPRRLRSKSEGGGW